MVINSKLIFTIFLWTSLSSSAQTQFGIEVNTGITMMRSTVTDQESPKGYYNSHLAPQLGNSSVNGFLINKNSMFELAFNKSYFFMNSTDRLLSLALGYDSGRGFYFNSGLTVHSFRFSYGRVFEKNKFEFIPKVFVDFSSYRINQVPPGSVGFNEENADNEIVWQYYFIQTSDFKLINRFGLAIGCGADVRYHIGKRFFLSSKLSLSFGLVTIAQRDYRSTFERLIGEYQYMSFDNSLSTKGSNLIWSLGFGMNFKTKEKVK